MGGFHALPRVEDGWSFLYVEHVRVEQEDHAIVLYDANGRVPVPIAALSVLMFGPGTSVTHAAMSALAENGCSAVWCGEGATRFYAAGLGETHRAANLMAQAEVWADPVRRGEVVQRMYRMRFKEALPESLTLEQVRGMEGVRVRDTYARLANELGVEWRGRSYRRGDWDGADPINRAISAASASLYALCHAAIVATGFSPGLGFIHTGKMLAFVYDVADLYRCELTVPVAFSVVSEGVNQVEARVRRRFREMLRDTRILARIVPDMQEALGLRRERVGVLVHPDDDEKIAELWDPERGSITGGRNYADDLGGSGGPPGGETPC